MYLHVARTPARGAYPNFHGSRPRSYVSPFSLPKTSSTPPGTPISRLAQNGPTGWTRISLGAQPAFDSAAFCSAPLFLRPLFGKRHEDNRVQSLCALGVQPVQYFWLRPPPARALARFPPLSSARLRVRPRPTPGSHGVCRVMLISTVSAATTVFIPSLKQGTVTALIRSSGRALSRRKSGDGI